MEKDNLVRLSTSYIIFSILALILFFSCNLTNTATQEFIIPEYNALYLKDSIKYVPYDYYGPNNVIIDISEPHFYYHNNYTTCGTGWKVTNPPRPINFEDQPLIKFNNIEDLLHVIPHSENPVKMVIIASSKDTIRNQAYFDIKHAINKREDMHIIATRKTTLDEEKAIRNKLIIEHKN